MASKNIGPRVSLACIPCRNKHVRCDAKQPRCGRCVFTNSDCQYAASRRGGLTRAQLSARRNPLSTSTASSLGPRSPASDIRTNSTTDTSLPTAISESARWLQGGTLPGFWREDGSLSRSGTSGNAQNESSPELNTPEKYIEIGEDRFVDLYYKYFHKSHPFLLPRWHLERQYKSATDKTILTPLILAVRFVGSLYARSSRAAQLLEQCSQIIQASESHLRNPYTVQCRLVLAIALYGYGEKKQSQDEMNAATHLALDLGMHDRKFAEQNGNGDAILEESWRRTWWQIYVADAFFAAMARANTFPTCNVNATVELPCEEEDYEAGLIPKPKTLEDFDNREFALNSPVYSSFAYLIGAVKGISSATQIVPSDTSCWSSPQVRTEVDAIIDGWQLLLPESKRDLVSKDGQVDELIFQALMAIDTYTVALHRPFSGLHFHASEGTSNCATDPPTRLPNQESMNIHMARCLRAIEGQVQLLALPSQQLHHTTFTICMVTTVALSLISACKFHFTDQRLSIARSQLRLMIGCLKSLAQAWPQAGKNMIELQAIAREILVAPLGQRTEPTTEMISQPSGDLESNRYPENDFPMHYNNLIVQPTAISGLECVWGLDGMFSSVPGWLENYEEVS